MGLPKSQIYYKETNAEIFFVVVFAEQPCLAEIKFSTINRSKRSDKSANKSLSDI